MVDCYLLPVGKYLKPVTMCHLGFFVKVSWKYCDVTLLSLSIYIYILYLIKSSSYSSRNTLALKLGVEGMVCWINKG